MNKIKKGTITALVLMMLFVFMAPMGVVTGPKDCDFGGFVSYASYNLGEYARDYPYGKWLLMGWIGWLYNGASGGLCLDVH